LAQVALGDFGGKALFVKEIEEALLEGRIDVGIHSLKDMPAVLPAGLSLAAFPPREDPRDSLVSRRGGGLGDLPPAAVVGTSSLRRRVLLLSRRPDLRVEPIRGNVETRDRKSTRLNSSHVSISYAVFCLKKKKNTDETDKHTHTYE